MKETHRFKITITLLNGEKIETTTPTAMTFFEGWQEAIQFALLSELPPETITCSPIL